MLSGHAGSLCTVHANGPREALTRLETLVLMADVQLPVYVARTQVASAIDLIVHIARFSEDGSRRVTQISEVTELDEKDRYVLRPLFALAADGKEGLVLQPTGEKPSFAGEAALHGITGTKASRDLWEA
jgi:pilus assembly protein CpaF